MAFKIRTCDAPPGRPEACWEGFDSDNPTGQRLFGPDTVGACLDWVHDAEELARREAVKRNAEGGSL